MRLFQALLISSVACKCEYITRERCKTYPTRSDLHTDLQITPRGISPSSFTGMLSYRGIHNTQIPYEDEVGVDYTDGKKLLYILYLHKSHTNDSQDENIGIILRFGITFF